MKYRLSLREIPRAKPKGFPEGSGYISSHVLTRVTIQTLSYVISSTMAYKLCHVFSKGKFIVYIYFSQGKHLVSYLLLRPKYSVI